MFTFAEVTSEMTAAEILNYYRNLYYAEPQVTERGIVANAINDYLKDVAPRAEVVKLQSKINRMKKYDEERDIALHARLVASAKRDAAREIFEEIERNVHVIETPYQKIPCLPYGFLAELKKKYT